jgi:hypothetical protein
MCRKRDLSQEFSMQGRIVLFVFVAASFSCLALTGCGPRDPRVTIHGTVSLDGKPVSGSPGGRGKRCMTGRPQL